MRRIQLLTDKKDLCWLYHLMKDQSFPDTPNSFEEALPILEEVGCYGVYKNNQLIAGFIFGNPDDGNAFLDVVCAPNFHSKWATKTVLKNMLKIAFHKMNLDFIWVEVKRNKALGSVLKAGFVYVPKLSDEVPTYILSKQQAFQKYKGYLNKEK